MTREKPEGNSPNDDEDGKDLDPQAVEALRAGQRESRSQARAATEALLKGAASGVGLELAQKALEWLGA